MAFPTHRMRRLRRTERFRNLVRETRLSPESMIYPIFVCPGEKVRNEVGSMPGQYNLSIDNTGKPASDVEKAGTAGLRPSCIPSLQDAVPSDAFPQNGILHQPLWAL